MQQKDTFFSLRCDWVILRTVNKRSQSRIPFKRNYFIILTIYFSNFKVNILCRHKN